MRWVLIQPALRMFLVVERDRSLSELESVLGIEHHRQLFGSRCILARHDRPGMRTVRNAAWMTCNRGRLNPAPRPEIATHVKQYFVRFDVVVHPRDPDSLWMRIEHTWCKCADDITANLECLMDRRRLVDRAGDWLEVLRIKRERINVAVPADYIERMMSHRHLTPARAVLHQNFVILIRAYRQRLRLTMEVGLGIWLAHFDLVFFV